MKKLFFGSEVKNSLIIARIGIMLALTLVVQYLSGLAGIQLLTGSLVNAMLLISTLTTGLVGGLVIGLFTPFIGFLLGFSANVLLTPFIGISNGLFVAIFALRYLFLKGGTDNKKLEYGASISTLVVGAAVKSAFLYFITLKLILPLIMDKVPPALSATFGITQLYTALIGGAIAILMIYPLKKAKLI